MSEKLTESITFKCTDVEKIRLERIARSRKLSLSELMRNAGIDIIQEVQELLNCLQAEFDLTTDTRDMRESFDFELTASPKLIDVTPTKTTGTKKAQLRDQLSLIATPMN
ncbi:hypothetical protein F938_00823 [Acinetobacter bereziniae LMG 1003 = CIP 70.12]|uniref:Uncharacterized protein n=1 Tax=Acinetobacter bereziniae LMG 1003 = CIP 70.12 TaxID=981324 RepID=N9F5R1_ACIBZ|nr:hypothetical protein [Acinetobacter bereziniae]ENW00179.1 hypothetical protein F938_00823 [Acinetobacter bereziniae LMG 1003 = CIP 70.12]